MKKISTLKLIAEKGLVVVVRADGIDEAKRITESCLKGGAAAIEITYTIQGATELISGLSKEYGDDIIIGAGTVLDSETARISILAGARYVVSPYFSPDVMKMCNRYQVPCMPGVMSPQGIVEAMEAGADILKIFPGEAFGPKIIKAFKGPFPQANMMPTGGVSLSNAGEWISNGAVAVGVGGSLIAPAKTGDYDKITEMAKQFVSIIMEARSK